jgi:hypothetical protein
LILFIALQKTRAAMEALDLAAGRKFDGAKQESTTFG